MLSWVEYEKSFITSGPDQTSLDAFWIAEDAQFLPADNEDSDRTFHNRNFR